MSSTLALSSLWSLGVLCEQEGVYIASDEENIESESLTSRASALTRKIAYKKAAVLFLLSPSTLQQLQLLRFVVSSMLSMCI